jgi:ABC-2 type transport system ATP-binding protein
MIEIRNVSKIYRGVTVLDNISLTVDPGVCFALLGTNGSGRSTLLNIVGTLVRATSGQVTVAGLDVRKHTLQVRRRIGYVFQSHPFPNNLNVYQHLAFIAATHGLQGRHQGDAIASVLAQTDLAPEFDLRILSRGYRQQLAIATALLHNPAVFLLDEPLAYLDPLARDRVRALLLKQRKQGKTILLACNNADDLAGLCDRIAVLHGGRLVAKLDAADTFDLATILASSIAHGERAHKRPAR